MGPFRFRWLAAALVLALGAATPSGAINIVLVYDDLGENPSYDPNGTRLMAIADAAATIWERLIPSSGTHTVDVSWSDLGTGNELGLWKFDPFGNNNLYFDTSTSAGWFFDTTPLGNGEFDFGDPLAISTEFTDDGKGSYLADELSAARWFEPDVPPPTTLEIGYLGLGTSGDAANKTDLLSVVLHEMGHELGVGGDILSGAYPLDPDHVLGIDGVEVIEGNCEGGDEGYCDEHGHIAPPLALMSPLQPAGVRTLPSAVDVLVAARDSNYASVDLARKFAGRSGSWGDSTDWIGGRVPDADDDAYLVFGGTTSLTGSRSADSVFLDDGTTLDATGDLAVDHEIIVGGRGTLRSAFGSEISANELDVREGGDVELTGGHLVIGGGQLGSDANLTGRGIFENDGSFVVIGTMSADGGDLRLDGSGSIRLDRGNDIYSPGLLKAVDGNLGIDTAFSSSSDGSIRVGAGHNVTALRDLVIPGGIELTLGGDANAPATLNSVGSGIQVTVNDLDVGANGQILASDVRLQHTVNVGQAGNVLTLSSGLRTALADVLVHGQGTVVQDSDLSIQGNVNVSVGNFDWGNSTASSTRSLTIDPNATLHVTSSSLGSTSGAFRGEMQIDSGVLDVETATGWSLPAESVRGGPAGTLGMIHSGAADPVVQGATLRLGGNLVVAGGDAFIQAPLISTPSAVVFVWGNSRLVLDGPTTMGGGSWSGDTLVQSDDIDVTHDTTIATDTFDWGNSFGLNRHSLSVENGATLTVASHDTGDPDNQFRGGVVLNGGRLVVNTDQPWTLPASSLFLAGGGLTMDGSQGAAHVSGQSLSVGGSIDVTGGEANIDTDLTLLSTSTTHIAAGATLDVNGATGYDGAFSGDGTLHHNGSAFYVSSTPLAIPNLVQDGLFTFASISGNEAELDTNTLRFAGGSQTRLFSDLRIKGAATVEQGATFSSGGTLIIDAAGSLSGASISAPVRNEGTLSPGFSPGLMEIGGDFAQLGTLSIELGGTQRGITHDAIDVDGDIALDGELDLLLYGGFTPVAGDSFDILDWTGSLAGAFDSFVFPAGSAASEWDLSDLYTKGELRFVPEPGTALLLALGLAALRVRRLRV